VNKHLDATVLVGLGERKSALLRLPDSCAAAQQELLAVLLTVHAPKFFLKKPVKRRLTQPRRGRVSPLK